MTRSTFTTRTRRIGIALAVAALAVPAAAQAYPEGVHHSSHPQSSFVPTDPGQLRITEQAPSFVPSDPNLARVTSEPSRSHPYMPISINQADAPVTVTETSDSGFNWSDALIGAAVTAGLLTLAMGGAMIARRQGGLGYR